MRRCAKLFHIVKCTSVGGLGLSFTLGCLCLAGSMQAREPLPSEASGGAPSNADALAGRPSVADASRGKPSGEAAGGEPQEQRAASLAGTLQELQAQMNELSKALQELRAEVASSRQESLELRRELAQTREKLASFEAGGQSQPPLNPLLAKEGSQGGAPIQSQRTALGTPSLQLPAGQQVEQRLDRLQEDQQLLSAKVDDQYQTKVESASKYRVRLSGIALINLFGNSGSVDNQDVPELAVGRGPLSSSGSFGATVRQSSLGLEVFGPTVGTARTSGDIDFDFLGGFPNTSNGVTTGLVRLRTARIHFDWPRTSIVAGQDAPFFSPLSPTSLASLAVPALSYAGNLWTWTPQLRVEHRFLLSEGSNLLLQGGILDPLDGQLPYSEFYRTSQAGENSRQPAYATRVAWNDKAWGEPLALGVGSYYSRQDWGFSRHVDAWAVTADWDLPLTRWFSLSGEFYRGRALGGLGAAAGQSVVASGSLLSPSTMLAGLNTAGGWSQLKFRATERLEFNGAFGEDVPFARDLRRFPYAARYVNFDVSRNQSGFFNVIYHLRSNVLLSTEYRRLGTFTVDEGKETADQINLGVGVLF